eukprot:2582987-Rhodomonas_salina.1
MFAKTRINTLRSKLLANSQPAAEIDMCNKIINAITSYASQESSDDLDKGWLQTINNYEFNMQLANVTLSSLYQALSLYNEKYKQMKKQTGGKDLASYNSYGAGGAGKDGCRAQFNRRGQDHDEDDDEHDDRGRS